MDFTKEITVRQAYDCTKVQPCVHGSTKCGTNPGNNHGRHNAEIYLTLRTETTEVVLTVSTGWFLPQTRWHRTYAHDPERMGAVVEFYSTTPQYDDQTPQGNVFCLRGWQTCYLNYGYIAAEEGGLTLVTGGTDAAWTWLEERWTEMFGGMDG